MKRVNSNYHALHVLKTAEPRLRKAIVSNYKKDLVTSINECFLNVLKGDIKLTDCCKRKLRQHMAAIRKIADKRVPLFIKKKFIVQRGGFVLLLLSTVFLRSLVSFSHRLIKITEKICYVKCIIFSADRFKQPYISPLSAAQPKAPLPKNKKKKKGEKQKKREHPYVNSVNYRKKIREADIKRKTQIQAIAVFLKNVLPDTAFCSRLKSYPPSTSKTLRFLGTRTEEEAAALHISTIASTLKEVVYETPTQKFSRTRRK